MWPSTMMSRFSRTMVDQKSLCSQWNSRTRKFGTVAQTWAEAMVPIGEETLWGAKGM